MSVAVSQNARCTEVEVERGKSEYHQMVAPRLVVDKDSARVGNLMDLVRARVRGGRAWLCLRACVYE